MEVYQWVEQIFKNRGLVMTLADFEDFFMEYWDLKQIIDESDIDAKNKNKTVIDLQTHT